MSKETINLTQSSEGDSKMQNGDGPSFGRVLEKSGLEKVRGTVQQFL
jgi:hypothetical protein